MKLQPESKGAAPHRGRHGILHRDHVGAFRGAASGGLGEVRLYGRPRQPRGRSRRHRQLCGHLLRGQKSSTSRMRSAARQHYSFPTTAGCCCRRCGWWWPSRPPASSPLPVCCRCFSPCHHLLPANNGQVQTAHAEGRAGGRLGGGRPRTCRRAAVRTR